MNSDIGILIPVYNGISYLPAAVDSVLTQTDPNWTLYLVDDASTDGSRGWVQSVSAPKVEKLYNEKNLGLYPTLMRALEQVPHEWIVILMQDDRLKPGYLAEMRSVAARFPNVRALWATEDQINERNERLVQAKPSGRLEEIAPGHGAWYHALLHGCVWTISGSFTRRALYRALPFRPDLPYAADYDWLLRVLRREPMVYYEQALVELRSHAQQASVGHLQQAQDVAEYFSIQRANLLLYKNELSFREVRTICMWRWNLIARRMPGVLAAGRLGVAWQLLHYAWNYAGLLRLAPSPFALSNA